MFAVNDNNNGERASASLAAPWLNPPLGVLSSSFSSFYFSSFSTSTSFPSSSFSSSTSFYSNSTSTPFPSSSLSFFYASTSFPSSPFTFSSSTTTPPPPLQCAPPRRPRERGRLRCRGRRRPSDQGGAEDFLTTDCKLVNRSH